ncbi:MAG TPA: DsbA family oxidoreductase [Polyangiaceae bacterium]|nr:DsbA family oxidoreductase [Polyangiaceae bacterium]
MKIEIWSDVICPWCGLGQHRLERALAAFAHRDDVEVVHRSFQLDPSFPERTEPARDMLARKYRLNDAQLDATFRRVEGLAAADGLSPYIVGDNVVGNTRLAHELLALASERGLEEAAWKRLYRAYFGERRSIFDIDSLVALGVELGLDAEEVRAALRDGRYRARVEAEGEEARALGASGVPFVVIDRRYAVAGAQPIETFKTAIERAWQESARPVHGEGDFCGPDGC